MNRISLVTLRYVCGALFLLGSMQVCADEVAQDHVPVGTRMLSKAEHASLQELRAKEAQESGETPAKKVDVSQKDVAKGILESKASRMAASINGVNIAPAKAATYVTTHPGALHNPLSVSLSGDTVELGDGSMWSISSSDCYKTLNWLTTDILFITPNHDWFSVYDYCITNQNTGVTCRTNLRLGPVYDALFRHWIIAIDYSDYRIWLEDGSEWELALGDFSAFQKFLIGDTVIIGINDGWFSSYNPNILINVNMANYVRGKCVR